VKSFDDFIICNFSGLYIVKATDKAGHKATAKFVIK
jgi:hypothetical protein